MGRGGKRKNSKSTRSMSAAVVKTKGCETGYKGKRRKGTSAEGKEAGNKKVKRARTNQMRG